MKSQLLPPVLVVDSRAGKQIPFNEVVKPGRISLITFWGTWCAHGKHQVKTIAAKLPEWRKQVDFDFVAIAEDQQGSEPVVAKYIRDSKWTFPCYTDAAANLKPAMRFFALPHTIVVDRNGRVAYTHTGYSTDGDFVSAMVAVR